MNSRTRIVNFLFFLYILSHIAISNAIYVSANFNISDNFEYMHDKRNLLDNSKPQEKMKPPEMPKRVGKVWTLCCDEANDKVIKSNQKNNYVWPMETTERIYFYVRGKMSFPLL